MRTARAAELAVSAANLLQVSIFLPLLLTVYDVMIVPVVRKLWHTEDGSPIEIFCSMVIAALVLPLQLVQMLLGVDQAQP
jgi:hypothetical protein